MVLLHSKALVARRCITSATTDIYKHCAGAEVYDTSTGRVCYDKNQ